MVCRHGGMKTEQAFAAVLGLPGNPYDALLNVASLSPADMDRLVTDALAGGAPDPAQGG